MISFGCTCSLKLALQIGRSKLPKILLSPRKAETCTSRRSVSFSAAKMSIVNISSFKQKIKHGEELNEIFTGLVDNEGSFTIGGFGSLLSEASARSTFPELRSFRQAKLPGFRRVFAHTCTIFFERGIARPETNEISSLSCEEAPDESIIITLFEVEATPAAIKAFIEREHEFRFLAVEPVELDGSPTGRPAVVCGRWNDADYRQRRCGPEEWQRRYVQHGVDRVWRDDVLPCRLYLRHCVLAAQNLGIEAYDSFLDHTWLADGSANVREWLKRNPDIMLEEPPASIAHRYGG